MLVTIAGIVLIVGSAFIVIPAAEAIILHKMGFSALGPVKGASSTLCGRWIVTARNNRFARCLDTVRLLRRPHRRPVLNLAILGYDCRFAVCDATRCRWCGR